ncbi:MAG: ABC transporter permease [Candidatus Thorarchaeota archaeon]
MKFPLRRIWSYVYRKEIKVFSKDRWTLVIFILMPILIVATAMFAQNTKTFSQTIGLLDQDTSTGYSFTDNFNNISISDLQTNWQYNDSGVLFLNISQNQIQFNSSTAIENEQMYFQRDFNTITNNHNSILIAKCDTYITNASLTGFTALSLGLQLGDNIILSNAITFQYGNITVLNGSITEKLRDVANESWYHIEFRTFLQNKTYDVYINETFEGNFRFGVNITTFNMYQAYLYPSASPFNDIEVLFDNVSITVDATPNFDVSANLTQYFMENLTVILFDTEEAAQDVMLHRGIHVYIIIPNGFETNLTQDLPTYLNITSDGTSLYDAPDALEKIQTAIANFRIDNEFVLDFLFTDVESSYIGGISAGPISMALQIPAALIIAFIGVSMITASWAIVGDQPLPRMLLTPLRKQESIMAKFMAYTLFSIFQVSVFLTAWLVVIPNVFGWEQYLAGSVLDCFFVLLVTNFIVNGVYLGVVDFLFI